MSRVRYARLEAGIIVPRGSTVGLMCQAFNMSAAALGYPHLSLTEDLSLLVITRQAAELALSNRDSGRDVPQLRQARREIVAAVSDTPAELHQLETSPEPIPPVFKPQSPPFDEGQLPPPEYFVGRLDDLEWVMCQMREGRTTAITALNGLGGIGKTSLAAVVVHKLREEDAFPDGIAVIFCIGLTDAIDVLRRVLARFHPQRRQPEPTDLPVLYEIRVRYLKGKKALIVLDNVDPELAIAKVLAPLKTAGPTLLL